MNKSLFAIFSTLFLCVLLTSTQILQVSAYSWTFFELPANYAIDTPQNCFLQHSTGALIYVYWSETTDRIIVKQYTSVGLLDATVSITPVSAWEWEQVKLCIIEYNSTYALIGMLGSFKSAGVTYSRFNTAIWKVSTHSQYSTGDETSLTSGDGDNYTYNGPVSAIIHSGEVHFLFWTLLDNSGNKLYFNDCKFVFSTTVLTDTNQLQRSGGSLVEPSSVLVYQNPDSDDQIYFVSSEANDDIDQAYVYRVDVDTGATSLETMATIGQDRFTNDLRMALIGAGLVEDSGDSYLYWDLARPYLSGTDRNILAYSFGMQFNGSDISLAGLLDTNEKATAISPTLPASSEECWVIGFADDEESFTLYFPYKSGDIYYVSETEATFDFFDFGSSVLTLSDWVFNENIPIFAGGSSHDSEEDMYSYVSAWTALATYDNGDNDYIFVYWNIFPTGASYDFTLSYTPNDNPLETDTNYYFTVTNYINGIATPNYFIRVYLNDAEIKFLQLNYQGKANFYLTFSKAGAYNLTIELWDSNANTPYSEDFVLAVVAPDSPGWVDPTKPIMPTFFSVFNAFIPGLIVIGIPMFMIGSVGAKAGVGVMGFIFGALIGAGLGYTMNVIPATIFFMLILFVAVMLVMIIRSKFSGG